MPGRRTGQRRDAPRAPNQVRNGWRLPSRLLFNPPPHLSNGQKLSRLWGPLQPASPGCAAQKGDPHARLRPPVTTAGPREPRQSDSGAGPHPRCRSNWLPSVKRFIACRNRICRGTGTYSGRPWLRRSACGVPAARNSRRTDPPRGEDRNRPRAPVPLANR
jgi:hypothetical protein